MAMNEEIVSMFQNVEDRVPFLKLLGLTGDCWDVEKACIRFPWRDEFMGKPKVMHGGVISAVLDAVGAFIVLVHCAKDPTLADKLGRGGSTIDLRVDYLLPGEGRQFVASGNILRVGKKVAVVRMELHNDQQELIAVGTGTYMIG